MTLARRRAAAFAFAALCAPASAQEIGRLFHSAEQRKALDSLRKAKPQPQKPGNPQPGVASGAARIDGYVVRPDGKSTVWVDGHLRVRH